LDRHLPAREGDKPRARALVALEKRRPAKGVCGGRQRARRLPAGSARAVCRAAALVHGNGESKPSREGQIRRMLGAQYAADAAGLQDELDVRCDGFGW
jgi:hypothetical protein